MPNSASRAHTLAARRELQFACVFILLAGAFSAPAQVLRGRPEMQPGKGVIQGTVVDGVTREPLKKAQVMLAGMLSGPPTAITDSAGHFLFRDLPAGGYWLTATKDGYHPPRSPADVDSNVQVTLTSDEEKRTIEIALAPSGSITGKVLDEDGLPVRGCSVMAVSPVWEQGKQTLRGVAGGNGTDDKGEYRIHNLARGRYYVFARCHIELAAAHPLLPRGDPRTPHDTYLPQFYGGGLDPTTATRLNVPPGTNLEGIDFEMHRTPAFTLRGAINSSDPELLAGHLSILLIPQHPLMRNLIDMGAGANPQERTFQIRSVIPGSYMLVAFTAENGRSSFARKAIEIGSAPPDPVVISLAPSSDLSGSVQFDSEEHQSPENAQIMLTPVEQTMYIPQPRGEIGKDGTFTITGVLPGRWRLTLNGFGYVKAMTLGGQQVSPHDFQIPSGGAGPLRITLGSKMGEVDVSISGSKPEGQISALLYPENVDQVGTGLERVAAGTERLSFFGVAPGKYRLLVTDMPNPWPVLQRPDLLKSLESHTQAADVTEGGKLSVTAEIVSRDELKKELEDKE
ncbi:MAG: carboxypeptidase-like regulatory domain-containing protein [Bryobacteraceae bacterium]